MANRLARKLLLIGWGGADWRAIRPLVSAGRMPHLKNLIDRGASGTLAAPQPPVCTALWTCAATGKRAHRHGIVADVEPRSDGRGARAVASTSRRGKALWNILCQNGLRTQVIHWAATHPAEPLAGGVVVSNRFATLPSAPGRPWPSLDGAVHPQDFGETLAALRVRPEEVDPQALRAFVPEAATIDQEKDRGLIDCAMLLARASNIHAVATWAIENCAWDFTAVLFDGIEMFRRQFAGDTAVYRHVIDAAYAFHDMMLGRLLQLAGDETTVLLVSDHGADHTGYHRSPGVWLMAGPGVKRGADVIGASLLDVTPTVLSMFGLTSGLDMDGRPWVEAMDAGAGGEVETDRVISWDNIAGDAGSHPPGRADASDPAIAHLLALGYTEPRDPRAEEAARLAREQAQYHTALSLAEAGDNAGAIRLLEPLVRARPQQPGYGQSLLRSYLALGMNREGRELVESAIRHGAPAALADVAMGAIELAERHPGKALEHLSRAQAAGGAIPGLHVLLGQGYRRLRRWEEAEQAFGRALEVDPDDPNAWHGLATMALAQDRAKQAAEMALRAIELSPDFPEAHYHLGLSLMSLDKPYEAAVALKRCLALRADMPAAYRALAELYDGPLRDPDAARACRRDAHLILLQRRGRSSKPMRSDDAISTPPKRSLS